MNNLFRHLPRIAALCVAALVGLSGCNRTPYASFQRSSAHSHEGTVRPVKPASPYAEPPAALSASRSADLSPLAGAGRISARESAESAIRVEVHRPTAWQRYKRLLPRHPAPPQCDQIVLRNGDVIDAKVKEVGVNEIRYKKCDRQDGPDYTISKRDVLSIKYPNGEIERFSTASTSNAPSSSGNNRNAYDSPTDSRNDGPRTDPFAIVALATGVVAVLTGYGAFLLGAAAIVFGALSLSRIRKEPGRFKGRGMAIAGMVTGVVAAGIILIYLLL